MDELTPGQRDLLSVARGENGRRLKTAIDNAAADDLEWFVKMMDYQLEETPNWIKDIDDLHRIQAKTRHQRTAAASALHNKRIKQREREKTSKRAEQILSAICAAIVGAIIGAVLTVILS